MRISLGLPTHRLDPPGEFAGPAAVTAVAIAAEQAGFDAVFVTDHPFPADGWLAHGGHHTLDPLVALAFVAAATTRLRLQTNLYVAAYRNPFVSAKAVATLDVLSGGRVVLGVGAGYLDDEFAALGVDFGERNDLLDEAITAMRAAWSGASVTMTGRHFAAAGNTMLPVPAQWPHPPIWVGGNSRRAIRRAVELADGWVPMPAPERAAPHLRTPAITSLADLRSRLGYLSEHAAAFGRTAPLDIVFTPPGLDMSARAVPPPDQIIAMLADLAAAGVTWATVSLPAGSRAELLDRIGAFGADVLPHASRL